MPARRPNELIRTLDVAPSTFAGWLNCLEDRGLIQRERDTSDRRLRRVSLTLRGQELALAARQEFEKALAESSDAELDALLDTLLSRLGARPSV